MPSLNRAAGYSLRFSRSDRQSDLRQQFVAAETSLLYYARGTDIQRSAFFVREIARGQQYHWNRPPVGIQAHTVDDFEAVHLRQHQVKHNRIGPASADYLQRLATAG